MDLSNEFEHLKIGLKDKWLDYYKANRDWIISLINNHKDWIKTNDKELRPPSYIILAALTAIEPELSQWLSVIIDFQKDRETIIEKLGLHFDPDVEIKKRNDKYNETIYNIQRIYYFFLANRQQKNDTIAKLLGIYFCCNHEYSKYLEDLEKCQEEFTNLQTFLEELNQFEQSSSISNLSNAYLTPETEYLNQIREQAKQESVTL